MITLSKSGNAVKFTFDENDHYLQNGTIEVPVNSLALIMDDSDMVTFRKSASNDIFVSANYSEFGMSKAELEAWYKTYMVGSSGGGGGTGGTTPEEVQEMIDVSLIPYSTTSEVDSMIDESVSGKADSSAVDTLNNTVTAHTADTTIHVTANEKTAWDNKSDFSGDYNDLTNKPTIPIVPTSNTAFTNDAGYITSSALNGYATEDYVTASTSTKLDVSTFETYSGNVESALNGKQPIGDYVTGSQMSAFTYDKQTIDEKISEGGIFDPTQYYTTAQTYSKTEANSLLDEKLDATAYTPTDLSNYDTKSEVNAKIEQATSGKVDTSTFNTYSGNVASALDGKVDDAEIADMATKTWVGNQGYLTEHQDISGKLDVSAFTAYSGAVDTTINSKASQASVDALNGVVTAHTANTEIHVTSAEKNAWNAKSDFSGSYNDLTDKPTIPTVPTSNTAFTNDARYITSGEAQTQIVNSISGKVDTSTYTAYTAATDTALSNKADTATTYTKTEVDTALGDKQDTLVSGTNIKTINNESILGSGNIDIQGGGGGGKAVSGGTNISITTGDTADTINCTLPIKTNNYRSLTFNSSRNPSQVLYASAFGDYTTASGKGSFAIGKDTTASGEYSFVGGYNFSQAKGNESFSFGDGTVANKNASVAFGKNITTNNECEFSCGRLNKSVSTSATFGNSGNTLFSVGNGTSTYHNAFEIRQNGDIYITKDGSDVKLQDQLGGGGGGGMTEDDELLLSTALVDLNERKIDASEVKSQLGNYQKKGDYVTTNTLNTRLAEYETALDEQNIEEVAAYALNELNERLIALETAVQALQALHNNE